MLLDLAAARGVKKPETDHRHGEHQPLSATQPQRKTRRRCRNRPPSPRFRRAAVRICSSQFPPSSGDASLLQFWPASRIIAARTSRTGWHKISAHHTFRIATDWSCVDCDICSSKTEHAQDASPPLLRLQLDPTAGPPTSHRGG